MLGQMKRLLQLGIDRFADETETIELFLSLLGPLWRLVGLGGSKQLHRANFCVLIQFSSPLCN